MITHDLEKRDITWQALLNCPEAKLLTAGEERDLLVELADCRERLLAAVCELAGTKWGRSDRDAEFQQIVRELASTAARCNPLAVQFEPLARRYEEIRTKLVMANLRLVAHVAKRFHGRGIPPGDLIQEGICALLLAIDRFDVANSTRLATYAIWWIRQGIQRAVATSAYPVRLNPRHLRLLARAGGAAHDDERRESAPAGLPSRAGSLTIERLLAATRPALSLDAPSRSDDETSVVEFFMPLDDRALELEEISESVVTRIKTLAPREQVVLNLRFGLGGEPRQTLVEVSHVLGVSKERVRQIEAKAMRKLRASLIGDEFEGRRRQRPA
jgi:RNA polymerase primary sigma factor